MGLKMAKKGPMLMNVGKSESISLMKSKQDCLLVGDTYQS